ncbi:hypothetical protein PM082_015440 [Marasmius tenuissimus]|nr:hypothetical protein PM082_015440 [Marasmius tenuissimus]
MHSLRFPLPQRIFYWSHDPEGKQIVPEDDWGKFGIPELELEEWIGSSWSDARYECINDYLCSTSHSLDGKPYAREHGYPELVCADPNETRSVPVKVRNLDCQAANSTQSSC